MTAFFLDLSYFEGVFIYELFWLHGIQKWTIDGYGICQIENGHRYANENYTIQQYQFILKPLSCCSHHISVMHVIPQIRFACTLSKKV